MTEKKAVLGDTEGSGLAGWCDVIRRTGEMHDREVCEWRAANPPDAEVETTDALGGKLVIGLWRGSLGDVRGVFYAAKAHDGYSPYQRLFLQTAVVEEAFKLIEGG